MSFEFRVSSFEKKNIRNYAEIYFMSPFIILVISSVEVNKLEKFISDK